jgi:zinc transport system substrate-binding protein
MIVVITSRRAALLLGVVAAWALVACGNPGAAARDDGRLQVVTSFYPLQFVASRVGGPQVNVTSLTPPGAEPHDLELTPRDVARLQDADLVVYLRGFQPAVDQAVDAHTHGQRVLDVAPAADLTTHAGDDIGDPRAAEHEGDDHEGHGHEGALDPHFWLDPTRLAHVTEQVATAIAQADPSGATGVEQRAETLVSELDELDEEFRQGLRDCASTDLVTSHSAFGYLAARYGLHQVGITGLTPESEPDPRSLARVAEFVRDHHVSTIYYETLVSPAIARTVARETGARTAVLDPLEGIDDTSAGRDYLEVMRSNLATLQKGQGCS